MKAARVVLVLAVLAAACGPQDKKPKVPGASVPSKSARKSARSAAKPGPAGDPCAVLRVPMVRYDAAGTPFAFSFDLPEGFILKDFSKGQFVHGDVTLDLNGDGMDEYVLRIAYPAKTISNPEKLAAVWREFPATVKVLEKAVGGRTMYVQRAKIGDVTGFVALFPVPGNATAAYHVLGGLTSTPKPCRDEAAEVLERMLLSFEPNPNIGPIPQG